MKRRAFVTALGALGALVGIKPWQGLTKAPPPEIKSVAREFVFYRLPYGGQEYMAATQSAFPRYYRVPRGTFTKVTTWPQGPGPRPMQLRFDENCGLLLRLGREDVEVEPISREELDHNLMLTVTSAGDTFEVSPIYASYGA